MNFERDVFDEPPGEYDSGHTLGDAPTHMSSPSTNQVADAFERRLKQQREEAQARAASYTSFDHDHEKRQTFRRLIDPGIMRPNPRPIALEALQTLLKLAENILEHPDEAKYQKFKTTNSTIHRVLVEPKGTIEYARELGFNPHVESFQPYYVFNKERHMADLKIGADILREALDRELTKEERAAQAKKEEKAVAAAHIANIKMQFYDDRKSQAAQARRERELRERSGRASTSPPTSPHPSSQPMPGAGYTVGGDSVPING